MKVLSMKVQVVFRRCKVINYWLKQSEIKVPSSYAESFDKFKSTKYFNQLFQANHLQILMIYECDFYHSFVFIYAILIVACCLIHLHG